MCSKGEKTTPTKNEQGGEKKKKPTLMTDLKYRPQNLVSLLALVRCVLGVLHLVAEFEQRVFQVVEAVWRRFAITRRSYRRHFLFGLGGVRSRGKFGVRRENCLQGEFKAGRRSGSVDVSVVEEWLGFVE